MTTKAKCEKLAKDLNVEIEIIRGYGDYDVNLTSPKGWMFGTLCHAASGYAPTMKEVWLGIWEDLQGITPCDDSDCETCQDTD